MQSLFDECFNSIPGDASFRRGAFRSSCGEPFRGQGLDAFARADELFSSFGFQSGAATLHASPSKAEGTCHGPDMHLKGHCQGNSLISNTSAKHTSFDLMSMIR